MSTIDWAEGRWTHDPEVVDLSEDALIAIAAEGSDAWRSTAYGFVHDSEHALLAPIAVGDAMEITFVAAWEGEFDQAGIFVRVDDRHWVKAGLEFADGHLGLGAVVTDGCSDWSVGHVDDWSTASVTMRVSRLADALIIRARADDSEWRLVRIAPFDGESDATAGPFLCGATRSGFSATFTRWTRDRADDTIH